MVKHLAVFDAGLAKLIFSGRKTIDGRFSKIKIAPFGQVSAGDAVLVKVSGEAIVGQFIVDRVIYFDHPTGDEIVEIKKKYAKQLAVDESFWLRREKITYITLMFIRSVNRFLIAPEIAKKDLRAWVVLG
jgi:hypothetical protein